MTKLDTMIAKLERAQDTVKSMEAKINWERSRLASLVTVKNGKGSFVLTYKNKSIVVPRKRNIHNEVNIFAYDGKRGEQLERNIRASMFEIKILLAEGDFNV